MIASAPCDCEQAIWRLSDGIRLDGQDDIELSLPSAIEDSLLDN